MWQLAHCPCFCSRAGFLHVLHNFWLAPYLIENDSLPASDQFPQQQHLRLPIFSRLLLCPYSLQRCRHIGLPVPQPMGWFFWARHDALLFWLFFLHKYQLLTLFSYLYQRTFNVVQLLTFLPFTNTSQLHQPPRLPVSLRTAVLVWAQDQPAATGTFHAQPLKTVFLCLISPMTLFWAPGSTFSNRVQSFGRYKGETKV